MSANINENLNRARLLLDKAEKVLIFAGAGMSSELGLETYWEKNKGKYGGSVSPYGLTSYEHAQGARWDTDRQSQLKYHRDNLQKFLTVDFHQEHSPYTGIKEYLDVLGKEYFVVTSNTDGGFLRTGYDENRIHEIHGNILNSQCLSYPEDHGVYATNLDIKGITSCPVCGGDSRPNCLFFVDFNFNNQRTGKQQDIFAQYSRSLGKGEAIVLEIGAGTTIATIRNQSLRINSRHDAPVIRINPHDIEENGGMKNIIHQSKTAPFIYLPIGAQQGIQALCDR